MEETLARVERACAWFGRVASWTVPVLVVSVCIGVLLSQMRMSVFLEWEQAIPLFGTSLSLSGLNDLQWHLFAIMVMLGGVYTLHERGHVCVDFLSARLAERTRAVLTILGDLLLLVPFAVVMTWFSWKFMMNAWSSGEGSSYGGLMDLWIIKSVMPLGFGLLALYGLARALRVALGLAGGGSR
jgi:TRAP-type mannitol/chloroaromatic compound transport system permease small subunit